MNPSKKKESFTKMAYRFLKNQEVTLVSPSTIPRLLMLDPSLDIDSKNLIIGNKTDCQKHFVGVPDLFKYRLNSQAQLDQQILAFEHLKIPENNGYSLSELSQNLADRLVLFDINPVISNKLLKKITDLPENTVLNVSEIKENGKGTRVITPTEKNKQKYIGSKGLRIVSDNLSAYLLAVSLLPNSEQYADNVIEVKEKFKAPDFRELPLK